MTFKTALKRFFTWDARATPRNREEARGQSVRDGQTQGRSSGSDTNYSQRFTH